MRAKVDVMYNVAIMGSGPAGLIVLGRAMLDKKWRSDFEG